MNDQYVAVTFQRSVDFTNPDEINQTVQWCKQQFK